ncbi:MAG: hypothetical protein LBM13_01820, partial [Candidatus Ancillula sp.]|nr:hypothetical protein [Candidatus Ancillula sp.]
MDSKVKLDGDLNGFSVRNPEKLSIEEYIKEWYELAEKKATKKEIESSNTLLELPKPYIVAGGRFQEMYYWDSFFTCLGLEILGKRDKIENILDNMAYEIKKYGFVPNANRSYYLGRSQPPFFLPLLKQFYLPSMWKSEWFEALGVEEEWWNSNRSITL